MLSRPLLSCAYGEEMAPRLPVIRELVVYTFLSMYYQKKWEKICHTDNMQSAPAVERKLTANRK